jgi:hypothetical protein
MNKQDYLIKKGRVADPDNGTLWVIKSTRNSVNLYELPVWEITDGYGETTWHDLSGNITRRATRRTYKLGQFPYEIDVYDDTNVGENHGYGTGIGDLWSWSYLVTPDKAIALKMYEDEKLRVQTKYLFF